MARLVKMISGDGKEFILGRFNEGNRTEDQIIAAVVKKYHNMFKRLGLPGYKLRMVTKTGVHEVPIEQFIHTLIKRKK